MKKEELDLILEEHKEWLKDTTKGKRANLSWANLSGADLSGANLRKANLSGADLDYSSGIPWHCGGTNIKLCNKLLAQALFHAFAQDNENIERLLTQEIRDFVNEHSHREEIEL